ncbi:MAG: hypothetical protein LRZ88_11365 [Candidatus Cloacimonetes bacterium]|nr:hypothetical protein [Candidatus Cloacimonadota bacterium]
MPSKRKSAPKTSTKPWPRAFKTPESAQIFEQLVIYEENHEAKMRELFALEFPGVTLN